MAPDRKTPTTSPLPKPNSGSSLYTPLTLSGYNIFVLRLSNTFAWQCPTVDVLLPFFASHFSKRHLDVGVGTGFYPTAAITIKQEDRSIGAGLGDEFFPLVQRWPQFPLPARSRQDDDGGRNDGDEHGKGCDEKDQAQRVTLLDLNPNALQAASALIAECCPEARTTTILADASEPLPAAYAGAQFDSISAFYLLHCMPGTPARKARMFKLIKQHLSRRGVFFGATILGRGAAARPGTTDAAKNGEAVPGPLNMFSRTLMHVYNWMGVFHNWDDAPDVFTEALEAEFEEVDTKVVGRVMLFTARYPRKD